MRSVSIRAEHWGDKLVQAIGFDDIDFESAEFSRKFFVKSPDKRWAYDVIHQETMDYLLQAPDAAVEFGGVGDADAQRQLGLLAALQRSAVNLGAAARLACLVQPGVTDFQVAHGDLGAVQKLGRDLPAGVDGRARGDVGGRVLAEVESDQFVDGPGACLGLGAGRGPEMRHRAVQVALPLVHHAQQVVGLRRGHQAVAAVQAAPGRVVPVEPVFHLALAQVTVEEIRVGLEGTPVER